jgi:hypothetical protein
MEGEQPKEEKGKICVKTETLLSTGYPTADCIMQFRRLSTMYHLHVLLLF